MTTGIGSVPFQDIRKTCLDILELLEIPFWPQFVKRSFLEDMNIQFSEGLPLLTILGDKRGLSLSASRDPESELVSFYDRFFAGDVDYFKISRNFAPGFYTLLELIGQGVPCRGDYIKGQTVGPITLCASTLDLEGRPILFRPELVEAVVRGLAMKSLWQARELGKSGLKPILFVDEPYLSGFGSAFSPIERREVVENLRLLITTIKQASQVLIGIHCCGNTDWEMLLEAGPDIINFDAYEYSEYFLLYPEAITRFLEAGGLIAWGIVPTSSWKGEETIQDLEVRLKDSFMQLSKRKIDPELVAQRSLLTPACGMGTMTPETAENALRLLSGLAVEIKSHR
jgi:hypothetical protein